MLVSPSSFRTDRDFRFIMDPTFIATLIICLLSLVHSNPVGKLNFFLVVVFVFKKETKCFVGQLEYSPLIYSYYSFCGTTHILCFGSVATLSFTRLFLDAFFYL